VSIPRSAKKPASGRLA